MMYYGKIKNCDIANGIGVRVTLFVSGCTHHCKGCFNTETWNFKYGQPFTIETENQILDMLAPSYINGLTLLGGEPFEPENQKVLLPFLYKVKKKYPNKDIWAYTGYTFEQLTSKENPIYDTTKQLLKLINVLVDGEFKEEYKDIRLRFRGSSNQRIIDLKYTRKFGKIVLWDDE